MQQFCILRAQDIISGPEPHNNWAYGAGWDCRLQPYMTQIGPDLFTNTDLKKPAIELNLALHANRSIVPILPVQRGPVYKQGGLCRYQPVANVAW